MITRWSLQNFKSVGGKTELALKPLTVLAGANSSGKSSLLHSVLLVRQTMESKVTDRPLVLNGEYVKLGAFEDVLHHGALDGEFSLAFTLGRNPSLPQHASSREGVVKTDVELTFSLIPGPRSSQGGGWSLRQARYSANIDGNQESDISVVLRDEAEQRQLNTRYGDQGKLTRALQYSVAGVKPSVRQRYWFAGMPPFITGNESLTPIGVSLRHFVPTGLVYEYDQMQRDFLLMLEVALDEVVTSNSNQLRFSFIELDDDPHKALYEQVKNLVQEVVQEVTDDVGHDYMIKEFLNLFRRGRDLKNEQYVRFATVLQTKLDMYLSRLPSRHALELLPLTDSTSKVMDELTNALTAQIRYLGPLRDEPKPIYEVSSSADTGDVGNEGQYTAAVLDIHSTDEVLYWDPQRNHRTRGRLIDAVIKWLREFDILYSVTPGDAGKLGHTVLVQPTARDKALDLTNVGVGVSQVLPIIVMSLLAEPGSTLLFEQPELHLHPKVQSRLGDFFLGLVRCGKQAIIETHSEHLINRLRLRFAEEDTEKASWSLSEQVAVYFVERIDGVSSFRPVEINEYGAIPDWPEGFFDQGPSEADRILQAAMRKKAAKRGPKHG